MDILREAISLSRLLSESGIEWAFVGGVAVGIHGYIRATEDIDIVIKEEDLPKLDELLAQEDYIANPVPVEFSDGFVLYRRVKVRGNDFFTLDVLIPPADFSDLLDKREQGTVSGLKIFVARKEDLIEMKKSAGRRKDIVDIEELEKLDGQGG